jgi:sodium/proline symporter
MWTTIFSFTLVLLSFLLVGLSSNIRRRKTTDDYLMAGRQMHPWLVGFAAASTNSSGFMFIGLIGATVHDGLSAMWLMVGWIVGDYFAWLIIHRRLRERSAELNAQSVSGFVASGLSRSFPAVRILCGLITVVFLATYAAAQFTAGSKGLEVLLHWPRPVGVLIGFGLLMLYCYNGGLRASIWVNTAQALVMIGSVMLLLTVALFHIGGFGELWSKLAALDPKYVDWRPQGLRFGFPVYMLSWISAGVGVIGQPHLMTIAMSIDSGENIARARRVYFVWYWIFSACCILVGLCCRVWLNDALTAGLDAEMALPKLASELLPGILVGVILGGLFAATLSTADTQILCSAAALTQDLFPGWGRSYAGAKLGMLVMAGAVVLTALYGSESVFELVVLSWSCLAASIGPILAAQTLRWPLTNAVGSAMILGGLGTALGWRYGLKLSSSLYEVLPGMLAGFLVYGAARVCNRLACDSPTIVHAVPNQGDAG